MVAPIIPAAIAAGGAIVGGALQGKGGRAPETETNIQAVRHPYQNKQMQWLNYMLGRLWGMPPTPWYLKKTGQIQKLKGLNYLAPMDFTSQMGAGGSTPNLDFMYGGNGFGAEGDTGATGAPGSNYDMGPTNIHYEEPERIGNYDFGPTGLHKIGKGRFSFSLPTEGGYSPFTAAKVGKKKGWIIPSTGQRFRKKKHLKQWLASQWAGGGSGVGYRKPPPAYDIPEIWQVPEPPSLEEWRGQMPEIVDVPPMPPIGVRDVPGFEIPVTAQQLMPTREMFESVAPQLEKALWHPYERAATRLENIYRARGQAGTPDMISPSLAAGLGQLYGEGAASIGRSIADYLTPALRESAKYRAAEVMGPWQEAQAAAAQEWAATAGRERSAWEEARARERAWWEKMADPGRHLLGAQYGAELVKGPAMWEALLKREMFPWITSAGLMPAFPQGAVIATQEATGGGGK